MLAAASARLFVTLLAGHTHPSYLGLWAGHSDPDVLLAAWLPGPVQQRPLRLRGVCG